MIYKFFKPLIFKLDAEKAHNLAIGFLRFFPKFIALFVDKKEYKNLSQNLFGFEFKNPIAMAAGFDKNACALESLNLFGFGFIEAGTVTPKPQAGNDKPRIFRLQEDEALINRLGFNNKGADFFEKNLEKTAIAKAFLPNENLILGVNIGKNKDTQNALDDYLALFERFHQKASYITLNISSPNTKNLRDLQNQEHLDDFLAQIMAKKREIEAKMKITTPIFLKIAPDIDLSEQDAIAKLVLKHKIDAVIISNTTISRPKNLQSKNAAEQGGLSGKPLFDLSNEVLRNFYQKTQGKVPLIGVGGIQNAEDIYKKIRLGASLVQIYSGFIYQGFGVVEDMKRELSFLLAKDGYENISQAIGVDNKI